MTPHEPHGSESINKDVHLTLDDRFLEILFCSFQNGRLDLKSSRHFNHNEEPDKKDDNDDNDKDDNDDDMTIVGKPERSMAYPS